MLSFQTEFLRGGKWRDAGPEECLVTIAPECHDHRGRCCRVQVRLSPKGSYAAMRLRCQQEIEGYECAFKPHLSPEKGMVVGEKAFRSPVVILENKREYLALIPNLDELEKPHDPPFFMDYSRDEGLCYGVGGQTETGHVYYKLTVGERDYGKACFSFYLARIYRVPGCGRDFRGVTRLIWELFGTSRLKEERAGPEGLLPYAGYGYGWAFDRWKDVVWQEFDAGGKKLGGAVFIVTAGQKPGLGKENVWREPKSLWNQAWFCGVRSACGYYRYGRDYGMPKLMGCAEKALRFALSAPKERGLFASYYEAGEDGDMSRGRWVLSAPRRPRGHEEFVHLLDNSWTCYWLLHWYQTIRKQPEILAFVQEYVAALLPLQQPDGSFPAWVRPLDMAPSPYLHDSPECAAHVMTLCALYQITGEQRLLESAEATARFLTDSVIPQGRWEDFETYWSCSQMWDKKQYGIRDARSGLFHQCNFSIYWCAEAMLSLYRITKKPAYLEAGEQVLAELSLYQQLCRPSGFVPETLGGFGVMNTDDEWNDARQSLFALTYLRYYRQTGRREYRLRALYSMKASFYMMYCPENAALKELYETVHPQLDERDYGFMMENFNHSDGTKKLGLGEFTIFDWGTGAACASLMEFLELYNQN